MPQISSPEKMLRDALRTYFNANLGGSDQKFNAWFKAIGKVTDGWKIMDVSAVEEINNHYDIPEWFMFATHATI